MFIVILILALLELVVIAELYRRLDHIRSLQVNGKMYISPRGDDGGKLFDMVYDDDPYGLEPGDMVILRVLKAPESE